MIKLTPVSHGNHNNIHFKFKISKGKEINLITIKLVAFEELGECYVTMVRTPFDLKFINKELILELLTKKVKSFDFDLIFNELDWEQNQQLSTEEIINKFNLKV